ncbi:MAG: quinoprotein dehydrogenase-associated SoxYZ-like carrier [Rhodocyclaceae bacterium]|nr:quinoprotein dehydrogenase-associated SoxYZ-like carrier [Rhodocyclaceae bacterium]
MPQSLRLGAAVMLYALALVARAGDVAPDPLNSSRWHDVRRALFPGQPVRFDSRVEVTAPATAEDSLNVPVSVRVTGGLEARRILVFAEMNPIVPVLEFEPLRVSPYLSFRMKLQQASPIRAAVLDAGGAWHVGSAWVDAAGGGCTAPGSGRAAPDWQEHLNEVQSRFWSHPQGEDRLRLRISHPMDTGLAASIPAFFLQELVLTDETGAPYLRLKVHEPVSQNPVFSFDIPAEMRAGHRLRLTGVDNGGNRLDRVLE